MRGYDIVRWALGQDCPSGEKNVLAALALSSDEQGVTFSGQVKIASVLTTTDRSVRGHLSKLAERGLITRYRRQRQNGSRMSDLTVLNCPREGLDLAVYSGLIVGREQGDKMPTGAPLPVGPTGKDAQANRQESSALDLPLDRPSSSGQGENAHAKLKIAGRAIDPEVWRRTRAAVAAFNSATGKSLDALNGRRQPSDNAKRIYGRLLAYPDLSDERVAEIIHRTIESRWWGEDAPSVGVVFGPKIFETNMERGPGEAPKRSGRGASDDAWAEYVGDGGDVVDADAEEIDGGDEDAGR